MIYPLAASWPARAATGLATALLLCAFPVGAQAPAAPAAAPVSTPVAAPVASYADVVSMVELSSIVARVEIRKQVTVEPARAQGLASGKIRLYVQARTESLLAGRAAVGESLNFVVDLPLDAKGKAPKLKKQRFLVFAVPVKAHPGQLQLVRPDAMLVPDAALEQQVRTVATQLASPDAPPKVTGVREAMSVRGNLAGESETQLFLDTANGAPVSLSVVRRPGMEPEWGVSWTEIVDQSADAPRGGTLEWYRLACALPKALPATAYLQTDSASRYQTDADYAFILQSLGPCARVHG
ncbi:MAG: hypothetical protein RLZZ08_1139 [Pseudomonadota bacterium]|jgi:hypothetical protein